MQETEESKLLRFPYEAPEFFEIPIARFTARGESNDDETTGGLPDEKKEDWDDPFSV